MAAARSRCGQLVGGHEETVLAGVSDDQVVALYPSNGLRREPLEAPDAMVVVDNEVAFPKIVVAAPTLLRPRPHPAMGPLPPRHLSLAEHGEWGQHEAGVDAGGDDGRLDNVELISHRQGEAGI